MYEFLHSRPFHGLLLPCAYLNAFPGGEKGTQQILKREATPRQAPGPEV